MVPTVARQPCPRTLLLSDAWAVSRVISPRPMVRVAASGADGAVLNAFPTMGRLDAEPPSSTWALHLADAAGRFRLVVFDLDDKAATGAAATAAQTLSAQLTQCGVKHLVCASGPEGGRHIWVRLAEAIPAQDVARLAEISRELWPCLDIAPLMNPTTGCVRPPGAPHRNGGTSHIIAGSLEDWLAEPATTAHLDDFITAISAQTLGRQPEAVLTRPVPLDDAGRPHLPGERRILPPTARQALATRITPGVDASRLLRTILVGAAAARWRYSDVAALAETSPGLEHVRTERHDRLRRNRPATGPHSPTAILVRQWERAVTAAAAGNTRDVGTDPDYNARAAALATTVSHLQSRADACPGRWDQRGGPSDRRILDALCLLALEAVTTTLAADIRRLALVGGVGRETARVSLLRLAEDNWITRTTQSAGRMAATWQIVPQSDIHTTMRTPRSQVDPRPDQTAPPEASGAAHRLAWRDRLRSRLTAARHDLFTPAGLGILVGSAFGRIVSSPGIHLTDLVATLGEQAIRLVETLVDSGAAYRTGSLIHAQPAVVLDDIAKRRGLAGTRADQAARYALEQLQWAWWTAETTWLRQPKCDAEGRRKPRRRHISPDVQGHLIRPTIDQLHRWRYPRHLAGQPDHATAQKILTGDDTRTSTVTTLHDAYRAVQAAFPTAVEIPTQPRAG